MNDTWDRLLVFCKHLCTETTYWPFLQKYWQQTTHNKKNEVRCWRLVSNTFMQRNAKGCYTGPQARYLQYYRASQKCLRCCSSHKTTSEKIKHCSVDLKKKKKKHKQLTFAVTAFQDGRVLSDHGSQSIDISIRRCLIHQGQVDFLGWVTSMNQTDTLLTVYGVNPLTHRITQPKLSPTQVIH